MNVHELTIKGQNETILYACGECGRIASPGIYLTNAETSHAAARRAAEECCKPYHCSDCGAAVDRYRTRCGTCFRRARLQKATQIEPHHHTGPVFHPDYDGDWGEGFSSSIQVLLDYCHDEDLEPPAYVHPCTARPLRIDVEDLFEQLTDERHETAADGIIAARELEEFIGAWNEKQTYHDYVEDHTTVIVLDRERFEALIAPPSTD